MLNLDPFSPYYNNLLRQNQQSLLNYQAPPPMKTTIYKELGLNQIEGFVPVLHFRDDSNTEWNLIKAATDSSVDVPDPKGMQIVDYWNHEFPNLKETKLYIYVVEGVRQPRVETEAPSRVLYQWFSTVFIPSFNPQMITQNEWLKANVYAAQMRNDRVSKLKALCKVSEIEPKNGSEDTLLKVNELNAREDQRTD